MTLWEEMAVIAVSVALSTMVTVFLLLKAEGRWSK